MTPGSGSANAPLRLAVIAHALRSAGGLTVGRNLIEAMIREGPDNEYCFIVPDGVGYEAICDRARDARVHPIPAMGAFDRLRNDRSQIPKILESFSPDIVLALDSSHGLRDPHWQQAVFVQDAHPVYPSKHYGPRTLKDMARHAYLKRHLRRSLAGTGLVFVQTEAMASRLRGAFAFSGKISVCGSSISSSLVRSSRLPSDMPVELGRYADRFTLLCVAQYSSHKGIERIVDVFHRFRDELAHVVVFLTITPDQHRNVARILKRIEKQDLTDQIVNLGEVPHVELGPYYEHCDAMLMPTTLESFGFPYLEALECNLPILTSDLDFAHETCGDAALYFDPWKPTDIKDTILRLERTPGLRDQLIDAGRNRTQARRTWDEIALGVLRDLGEAIYSVRAGPPS